MDIQNKKVLVLGGWGLVGNAVTKKLISENPNRSSSLHLKKKKRLMKFPS